MEEISVERVVGRKSTAKKGYIHYTAYALFFLANSREDNFGAEEDDRLEDDFYLNNVYDRHFQSQKDYKK